MDTIITILTTLLASAVFAIVASVLGCLLAGLDRKITARMQGRVGPPILQPYYDVRKLFMKENAGVNSAIGTYGSFDVEAIIHVPAPIIGSTVGVFIGMLFILTIKLRKSPFDLSYSHHAHQDLVKGVTTEMSGRVLGMVDVMHWCENILFMAWIALFFVWNSPACIIAVVVALALVYFLEIWIDNNFARVKWQLMLKSAWIVTLVFACINIALLIYL